MKHQITQNGKLSIASPAQPAVMSRFQKLTKSEPVLTCPFLGLKEDPETLTNFASENNYCHCPKIPRLVPLDHQQMTCLFNHTRCPIFLKHMTTEVRKREKSEGIRVPPKATVGMVNVLTNLLGIK